MKFSGSSLRGQAYYPRGPISIRLEEGANGVDAYMTTGRVREPLYKRFPRIEIRRNRVSSPCTSEPLTTERVDPRKRAFALHTDDSEQVDNSNVTGM